MPKTTPSDAARILLLEEHVEDVETENARLRAEIEEGRKVEEERDGLARSLRALRDHWARRAAAVGDAQRERWFEELKRLFEASEGALPLSIAEEAARFGARRTGGR